MNKWHLVCSARKISFIIRSLHILLISLFRVVHALNRNIVCAYFPHGIDGVCCAHPNYVCTRRIEEKINDFPPLNIQLNLKHRYSDSSLIFVYIDYFLISYLANVYIDIVWVVLHFCLYFYEIYNWTAFIILKV